MRVIFGLRIWPVFLALSLVLFACGPVRMYPGPELPSDQVSLLNVGRVNILTLDGIPPPGGGKSGVWILPGEHELRITHDFTGYPVQAVTYRFRAEAGRRYRLDADYEVRRSLSWRPWIRDIDTGTIIGEWK